MDGQRKLAVIVPVYNNCRTLERCAKSILGQTYRNLELWLIDDGATDGSGALCDQIAQTDGRVYVIHKKNEGLMKTWMRGVQESSAPYLAFVDSDDWIEQDMLEKLAAALPCPEHPEWENQEVICGSYVIDREWLGTCEQKKNGAAPGIYEKEKLKNEIFACILGREERTVILSRCMKLFSRELLEKNMHYCDPSIRMGEDVNIVLPTLLDAKRVVILDDCYGYHYVYEASSMVHASDPGLYDNILRLRRIIEQVLQDKKVPHARHQAEGEFLFLFMLVMKNELRNDSKDSCARIQKLCRQEDTPGLMRRCGLPVQERANQLIAFMMRRPDRARILLVRQIFQLQKKRQSKKASL